MSSRKPWFRRYWHKGDVYALGFLLFGLAVVLFVAVTEGEYAVWTLWIALPCIMFSLAYLFLVSALPIFLGPRGPPEPEDESPGNESNQ